MNKSVSIADGLNMIDTVDSTKTGHSNVTLSGSETVQKHNIENMPDAVLSELMAIAEHPDGEPDGMDITAAYERIEPFLVGCPLELRPIP